MASFPYPNTISSYANLLPTLTLQLPASPNTRKMSIITKCEAPERERKSELSIGSPIIFVEAPPTLKTADSMPSLKINNGFVKPGDVGRIVARKPKDVWAVRLTIGTFLMDAKYFRPLDLDG
ncbi:hypothetical protein AMTRI_Chr03g149390 [Amborella trichopoda]|uniref:Chlororespiratory reduction 42 n=1 Tax=Amborella trichopoda TaxID=13333 RepID=W1NE10_AMBTC|nr:uncharacterized protein LOC18421566 [Amborella trichopoda]ERM93611.1 hypothetical protein AMTR_s00004p00133000 [Amborella trichopoda]|eukprot:XP_006826374.1 uncharacterized protein LOC18421566 [Amborella trichopoda]